MQARGSRFRFLSSMLAGLVVGLMAEISIHPFGTAFRFSLGPVTLAFVALFFPTLPAYLAGLAAGLMVPLVHAAFAMVRAPGMEAAALLGAVNQFLPETLAYTLMGSLFYAFRVRERANTPVRLAVLLASADLITNVVETLVRGDALHLLPALAAMVLVAIGRAFVAEGAYYVLREGVRAHHWERARQRYAEQVLFFSNLQTETFFLQKSARDMEQVMAKAHRLYRDLNGHPGQPLALEIAKDIHEVKKDAQRTLSALFRLVETPQLQPTMTFRQVVALVLDANRTYSRTLGKQVNLRPLLSADFCTPRFGRWITILNNLVSNAVEACPSEGAVAVSAVRSGDRLVVRVSDTGPGIPPEDRTVVFSPGFSTKLNPVTGAFSSGIGLTHVAGLVHMMKGSIAVEESAPGRTVFRLEVPWENLEVVEQEA